MWFSNIADERHQVADTSKDPRSMGEQGQAPSMVRRLRVLLIRHYNVRIRPSASNPPSANSDGLAVTAEVSIR